MKMRVIAVALSCALCLAMPMQVNASESESSVSTMAAPPEVDPLAAGLISEFSLSCSSGRKAVYITADTIGFNEMTEIGFINIKIQRSSDGKNWTTEKPISDKIKENAYSHALDYYPVSVDGGAYYRVTLDHYAKEKGWFFPSKQSVANTSSYVWVPN